MITCPVIHDRRFMEVPLLYRRGEAGSAIGSFISFPRRVGESVLLSLSRNGMLVLSSICIKSRFYGTNYTLLELAYAARVLP